MAPESNSGRMWGWCSVAAISISRRKRSEPTASASTGCSTLRATERPCLGSRARYTVAVAPRPSRRTISYRPRVVPGSSGSHASAQSSSGAAKAVAGSWRNSPMRAPAASSRATSAPSAGSSRLARSITRCRSGGSRSSASSSSRSIASQCAAVGNGCAGITSPARGTATRGPWPSRAGPCGRPHPAPGRSRPR